MVEQPTICGWCGWSTIFRLFAYAFNCPLCAWYWLRTRNVVISIGLVSLDLQILQFFPVIVTMMGSSCAPCNGFSWIFCPLVVFTNLVVYAAGEALFRIGTFTHALCAYVASYMY
ncbi:hypothetical protein DVH24_028662 [Malus domestica]|uniref:Uncharacterized protein n=1 Tax=Malus domestica TaxID=3750 RepID=A0A498IZM9_MALDO|nr:hypothetical protein DVH24_028662 [Malus domestica]